MTGVDLENGFAAGDIRTIDNDGAIEAAAVEEIATRFHTAYEREYTYRLDAPVEFVGAHVVAVAEVGKLTPARTCRGRKSDPFDRLRPCRGSI